jgi:class 3 adenylate cyclase
MAEMTEGTEKTKVSRRLAAILAADIAGYSALMGADEADTVRNLKAASVRRTPHDQGARRSHH